MKKKIFALLLALCVAFTMMPAMALAAETAENDANKTPTIGAYKDAEGTEELTDGIVNELDEFYVISNYVPAEGEIVNFYGNYGHLPGITVEKTAFNSKGYPYAKVSVTGKFDAFQYWITIWRDPSPGYQEEELCGLDVTITKSTSSLDEETAKAEVKDLVTKKVEVAVEAAKTSKGIKVKTRVNDNGNAIAAITNLGYKVKYQFLRSTSKTKNYKVIATKTSKTYVDKSAKKGTKYYYKCKVAVYDANGKLVAKTALAQSERAAKKR